MSDIKINQLLRQDKVNKRKFFMMHNQVLQRIIKQRGGAVSRGYGVVHFSKTSGYRDPVGVLVGTHISAAHFTTISSENNTAAVSIIMKRYGIPDNQRLTMIDFVQEMEDAHDDAFDPFNRVDDRMGLFLGRMDQIKQRFID